MYKPVNEQFFTVDTLDLAKRLIGCFLVHDIETERIVGRIVETEAYQGAEDKAAHSYNNRRTKRTEIMFHAPGHAYTYQMHTHTLLNVVSGPVDIPHAVLIRAVEPVLGIEQMLRRRGGKLKRTDLTNGPGKLTQAMGISMEYYGHHFSKQPLFIAPGKHTGIIATSGRIGIQNSGEAVHYPWRFFEKDNPYVSKFRK